MSDVPVFSQRLFDDVTVSSMPQDGPAHTLDIEYGDFNRDGHLDMVLALEKDVNRLYLNDGTGKFTWKQGVFSNAKNDSEDAHVADFNKDGYLDVIFVSEDDFNHEFYLGDGKGNFQAFHDRLPAKSEANGVEAADLDGDGFMDIVVANGHGGASQGGREFLWRGDSQKPGFFIDATTRIPAATETSQDVKFGDFNGDRKLDIIVANENPPNRLYIQQGDGSFVDRTNTDLDLPIPLETREALVFDVDSDGDLDLVFCNLTCNACGSRVKDSQTRILINDGKGKFKDETMTRLPKHTFSSWDGGYLDFDGDGHLDLLMCAIAVPGFTPMQVRAWKNDGKGFFTDITSSAMPAETVGRCWDIEVADLDKDGTLDVAIGGWGTQARLLKGKTKQPVGLHDARKSRRLSLFKKLGMKQSILEEHALPGVNGSQRKWLETRQKPLWTYGWNLKSHSKESK